MNKINTTEEVHINIFFAYSREDSALRDRLDKHLSGLKRKNYVNTWYDGKIDAGKEWEKEIDTNLSKADIVLLLISADFIASDYCYDVEMTKAISRHEKGDAVIIPIILNPCDWSDLPFSKIQGLPQNGKPITSTHWENSEIALNEVAKSIKDIVENLLKTKNKRLKAISEILNEKDNELKITLQQLEEYNIEQEIAREIIQDLKKEKKKIEVEILALNESAIELEKSLKQNQIKIEKIISKEQVDINKLRVEKEKLLGDVDKLNKEIEKLIIKKTNIEEDIKRKKITEPNK
ncbi:TIR domain-containing protein [uncultured Acetobacteroides sp.]|uniref:toll/interleukin-1 receptor domain-containing protein n=1 Tax=uncultured Acetobacteroides sp. TaxID=1760811 RepID=UPI0029F4D5D2|nr:TIR domain-containing protein [uncultured Acetobacteroides sp.]